MTKWARESIAKQCGEFKSKRMEVRKMNNEDRLRNLDAAKIKEIRALFMKQKLCEKRFKYVSLWLT